MKSDGSTTKYYHAFGRRVAMRTGSGTLSYLLADHLGSTVGAIDSAGAVTRQTYWPFGGTRTTSGALGTDKQYTGQQQEAGDAGLGLYSYGARFYSTVLGRFASADSIAADGLNRYSYVDGNPIRYRDPSGHCFLGLSCSWQDAQNWLACALSCGDNWLGDVSRAALTTDSFWGRFSVAFGTQEPGGASIELFEGIGAHATSNSLHSIFANATGGNYLASIFGAGWRGDYFEASLSDVLFGTDTVSRLSISFIAGASDWSKGIAWRLRFDSHRPSDDILHRLGEVGYNLQGRTLQAAQQQAAFGYDLNRYEWTRDQRSELNGNSLSVDVSDDETSVFQTLAVEARDCGLSTECLTSTFWSTDWERDWMWP